MSTTRGDRMFGLDGMESLQLVPALVQLSIGTLDNERGFANAEMHV